MNRWIALATMLAALAACGGQQDSASKAAGNPPAGDAQYTIAVVPKGLGHNFWNKVRGGAMDAGGEFNARIIWTGPDKETEIPKQINIINDLITQDVDAIVMAACDANALIDVAHTAMDEGIPVVTIDSGLNSERPVSFIATDNIAGAKAAAEKLVDLIGGEGQVGLMPFVKGAATSEMREEGFKEGIAGHDGVELVSTLYCDSDISKAMSAMSDMLTAHPELDGIFAANEAAAIGSAQAIEARGVEGEVKLVAFDASEEQLAALERGTIQALIVQNPHAMGYQGVKAAIDAIEGRPVPARIDTGVAVVTQENLDDPEIAELLGRTAR